MATWQSLLSVCTCAGTGACERCRRTRGCVCKGAGTCRLCLLEKRTQKSANTTASSSSRKTPSPRVGTSTTNTSSVSCAEDAIDCVTISDGDSSDENGAVTPTAATLTPTDVASLSTSELFLMTGECRSLPVPARDRIFTPTGRPRFTRGGGRPAGGKRSTTPSGGLSSRTSSLSSLEAAPPATCPPAFLTCRLPRTPSTAAAGCDPGASPTPGSVSGASPAPRSVPGASPAPGSVPGASPAPGSVPGASPAPGSFTVVRRRKLYNELLEAEATNSLPRVEANITKDLSGGATHRAVLSQDDQRITGISQPATVNENAQRPVQKCSGGSIQNGICEDPAAKYYQLLDTERSQDQDRGVKNHVKPVISAGPHTLHPVITQRGNGPRPRLRGVVRVRGAAHSYVQSEVELSVVETTPALATPAQQLRGGPPGRAASRGMRRGGHTVQSSGGHVSHAGGQNGTVRGGRQTPFIAGQTGNQLVRGPSPTSHEQISQTNRVPAARGHNGLISRGQGLTRVQTSLVRGQTSLRRGLISPTFRGQQLQRGRPYSGGKARLSNGQSSSTPVPMMQNGGVQVQRGQSSRSRFYSGPVTSVGPSGRVLPRLPIQQQEDVLSVTATNQQTKEGGGQRGHHSQVGKSLAQSTRGRGGLWQESVAPGCAPIHGGALPADGRGGHAGRRLFRSAADKLSPRQR